MYSQSHLQQYVFPRRDSSTTLSEPASKRFFAIQDLVDILAPFLHVQDISRLTQTCRFMKSKWQPFLYRSLNMTYYSRGKGLLRSPYSKLALSRNIRHVRILKVGLPEMVYLYNSMILFMDLVLPDTESDTRPTWLPCADRQTTHVVPLPSMTNLKQLEVRIDRSKDISLCPYLMPSVHNARANLAQLCWITSQSPNLVDLTLKSVAIKDNRGVRLLMVTLLGLTQLKTLKLGIIAKSTTWRQWGSAIFFSCSISLQKLQIDMQDIVMDQDLVIADRIMEQDNTDQNNHFNGGVDKASDVAGTLILRSEKLLQLKELSLWEMDKNTTAEDLVALFIHCPKIEKLVLPNIRGSYDKDIVAQILSELCQNLRHFNCKGWRGESKTKQLPLQITSMLPKDNLQEITYYSSSLILNDVMARKSFVRHSITLKTVILEGCIGINSNALGVLVIECSNLEILQVTRTLHVRSPSLLLEDAVASPWGSRKFRRLSLTIGIPIIQHFDHNRLPYYLRKGPVILSEAEKERFGLLERFYRQIGSLTELEYLDLRVDMVDWLGQSYDETDYMHHSFPGLMSLGNKRVGRAGYLDLLSGLSKLRELRGSFYARADETEVILGLREIVWFDHFWPQLEVGEFFFENEPVTEKFRWLQDQRESPSLQLFIPNTSVQ
ncbi:hypothetical protein FBU30_000996 [Linnemannia zychae]|nr:hypothetical protein FBU30_000996 [Linnemannia zychae]